MNNLVDRSCKFALTALFGTLLVFVGPSIGAQSKIVNPIKSPAQEKSVGNKLLETHFPINLVNDLGVAISQTDFENLLKTGKTSDLVLQNDDPEHGLTIKSLTNRQFSLEFRLYGDKLAAIRQVYGANTHFYMCSYSGTDKSLQWRTYLGFELPKLNEFFCENVETNLSSKLGKANTYFICSFDNNGFTIALNSWILGPDILNAYSYPSNYPLDLNNIYEYKIRYSWDGQNLVKDVIKNESFNAIPIFKPLIENGEEGGPGINEFDCPNGVSIVTSSELNPQGKNTYNASLMMDDNIATAWCEGSANNGVGEWIEFTITENYLIGNSYLFLNGYAKSPATWSDNNRVKEFKVYINGTESARVQLEDTMKYQSFSLYESWLKYNTYNVGTKIRFVITDVYRGNKYNDTLISHFVPTGNCG